MILLLLQVWDTWKNGFREELGIIANTCIEFFAGVGFNKCNTIYASCLWNIEYSGVCNIHTLVQVIL